MKKLINIFKGDRVVWMVFLLLSIISLVAVYSAIGRFAITKLGTSPTGGFFKHLCVVLATYVVVIILSNFNYRIFSRLAQWGYWASVVLLTVMAAIGSRWLRIPGLGQFQPSEIAKVLAIMYTARLLSQSPEEIEEKDGFIRILIALRVIKNGVTQKVMFWRVVAAIGLVSALILPENFSTAALVFLSCYILMFFADIDKRSWFRLLLIALVLVGLGLFVSVKLGDKVTVFRSETWGNRIEHWLHPDYDDLAQENIAKMAIARGKITGVGIGNTIHARLMTQGENDFIYAIILEEGGMFMGIIILAIYSLFFFRCIRISWRCKGNFGSLTVAGLGTVIYLQALVNMCVAVGVLPVTGQTLPFISYGGTAYLFLGSSIGVIQAVAYDNGLKSKENKKKQEAARKESTATTKQQSKEETPIPEKTGKSKPNNNTYEDIFADMDNI
ncbi:MAG: FtsW/RodA/SpoVE family cell cycle protein [Bacteroidales bacterium]|nr:FtsW/RodA/SpoVE family cell cycle protein [Candidatus Colimorpha pelethequi]